MLVNIHLLSADDDYEPSDGELPYTSISTHHCVPITILIDTLVEETEHFRVILLMSSSDRVNLVPPQTTVFIIDDSSEALSCLV